MTSRECSVCSKSAAPFRCRRCSARYCCSACFRVHSALSTRKVTAGEASVAVAAVNAGEADAASGSRSPCDVFYMQQQVEESGPRVELVDPATGSVVAVSEDSAGGEGDNAEGHRARKARRTEAVATVAAPDDACDDAEPPTAGKLKAEQSDELLVLQAEHLETLASDPWVLDKLKSSELQSLMRIINFSRAKVDALEAALVNVPEFREFCDTLMRIIFASEMQRRAVKAARVAL